MQDGPKGTWTLPLGLAESAHLRFPRSYLPMGGLVEAREPCRMARVKLDT